MSNTINIITQENHMNLSNHCQRSKTIVMVLALGAALGLTACALTDEEIHDLAAVELAVGNPGEYDGFIENLLSGKCIDVMGAPGMQNGDPLQLWSCELAGIDTENNSLTDQLWHIDGDGFIQNQLSQKCIDVAGAPGMGNGVPLQLWDCEFSGYSSNGLPTDQRWEVVPGGFIRNKLSNQCIDVVGAPGMSDGARLQLWDCELSGYNADNYSPTDQKWCRTNVDC